MNEAYSALISVDTEEMQTIAEPEKVYRNYVLPPATDTTLGGVIVGDGLSVDANGKLSATGQRKTATTDEILFYLNVVDNIASAFDYDGIITEDLIGKEIAKIEYLENGIWRDFEELNVANRISPVIRTNKWILFNAEDGCPCYATFAPILASPSWFAENSFIEATRVTYYI